MGRGGWWWWWWFCVALVLYLLFFGFPIYLTILIICGGIFTILQWLVMIDVNILAGFRDAYYVDDLNHYVFTHTKAYWFIYTQLFFLRKYDICRWSESLCCYTHGAYWFIYTLFFFFRKYDILLLVKSPLDPYHSTWNEIMCMDVYECYDELTRYDSEERKVVSHPTVKWLLFY